MEKDSKSPQEKVLAKKSGIESFFKKKPSSYLDKKSDIVLEKRKLSEIDIPVTNSP
jgi:hypothetical protein